MAGVVLVPGTWAWRGSETEGQWYQAGSPFVRFLMLHGVEVLSRNRPFVWSSRLGGLPIPTSHLDWEAAGMHLWDYINPAIPSIGVNLRPEDTNVIVHSHGLQVALYAAKFGCKFNTLISVGSPIRHDMLDVALAARPNIRAWWQLSGGKRDLMQWLGELFDGMVGINREAIWRDHNGKVLVHADQTIKMPNLNHSDLLCTPECFSLWERQGVLDLLQGVICGV